jgi:hypothetical protein
MADPVITPSVGGLSWSGTTPVVSHVTRVIIPATGSLVLRGTAPNAYRPVSIQPSCGAIGFSVESMLVIGHLPHPASVSGVLDVATTSVGAAVSPAVYNAVAT